jgi:hypothetical protein
MILYVFVNCYHTVTIVICTDRYMSTIVGIDIGIRMGIQRGQMLVLISNEQAQELEHYSSLSGVSVEQLTYEAFSDYIECVISSRSEALARKSASA